MRCVEFVLSALNAWETPALVHGQLGLSEAHDTVSCISGSSEVRIRGGRADKRATRLAHSTRTSALALSRSRAAPYHKKAP